MATLRQLGIFAFLMTALSGCESSYVDILNDSDVDVHNVEIIGTSNKVVIGKIEQGGKYFQYLNVSGEGGTAILYEMRGKRHEVPLCYYTNGMGAQSRIVIKRSDVSIECL